VQIDSSGRRIGMRYPIEVPVVGDAKTTLRQLIPLLRRTEDRSFRGGIEKSVARWRSTAQRQAMTDADPVNPMRILHEFSRRAPSDAIVTTDSGSAVNWYARHIEWRGDMRGSLSGTLATMGPAVPYAIGAKWAHPDRPSIAFEGDGAMQMNGLAEMLTVAHYWRQWEDPRLIVAVLHNNDLNQVTWEQRAMTGSPKFAASQTLPEVDYAAFVRGIGLEGIAVDDPEEIGPAWDAALAADRPTLLDIRCDPSVPPIPPHATLDQATALSSALVHGDEDAWDVVKQGVRQKVQQYLPGTKPEQS
jgi:pyruvate dehydrogenase (quinone)